MANKKRRRRNGVWTKFAEANGWYVVTVEGQNPRFMPPSLVKLEHRPKMSQIIHASFEGHECDIFLYEFSIGYGKNKRTYFYTIARVMLTRPFPHLILDSKATNVAMDKGGALVPAKLEGDFHEHFTLFYEEKEHIDALSVITPDIMQSLLSAGKKCDIEIYGNQLFFMFGQDHRGPEALPGLLKTVDVIADEIAHKARSIRKPEYYHPDTVALISAAKQYGFSQDTLMSQVVMVLIFVIFIPFLIFAMVGAFGLVAGI